MQGSNVGAELLLAALFLLTSWAVLSETPPSRRGPALVVLVLMAFLVAWLLALPWATALMLLLGELARWTYRQSKATRPSGLYRWL
jgi:hypothetical protein